MTHPLSKSNPDLATNLDVYDSWIRWTMHRNHQPGLALGIVYDGELLWGQGYGWADIEAKKPVTLDTRFRIASISKTFTAVAILQLRDRGALSLDDPVSSHLDWFDLRFKGAPAITIRNLLTHTSGLPRDSHNPMWTEYVAPDWDEFVEALKTRPPTRPPYDKFAYSNVGYSLLGGIIEQVSDESWSSYLQSNIVDPLGMTDTHPAPRGDDLQLAKGYSQLNDNYERRQMPFFLMNGFEASANFASSINDLVKYAAFHLNDDENAVLSPHSLRDMHRIHWLEPSWTSGYGLGSMQYKLGDWSINGHSGGYPGYLTGFTFCREHKTAVIVLTNALGSSPPEYINRGYKLVLPEIIKATKTPEPEAEAGWQIYLGEYVHDWGYEKVILRAGRLQVISLGDMEYHPIVLEPTDAEHVFTIQEQGGSNETLRFELDDSGDVVKMWTRNEYAYKTRLN